MKFDCERTQMAFHELPTQTQYAVMELEELCLRVGMSVEIVDLLGDRPVPTGLKPQLEMRVRIDKKLKAS